MDSDGQACARRKPPKQKAKDTSDPEGINDTLERINRMKIIQRNR